MLDDSNLGGTLPRYSAKRNLHRALFFCVAPEARQVSLVGDFNSWNSTATPMARQPDGRWTVSLELTHGYHEYLFLVDDKTGARFECYWQNTQLTQPASITPRRQLTKL